MALPQHIFMLGIEGSGMKGLAFLLKQNGTDVSGTDDAAKEKIDRIPEGTELLIYTDAAPSDHPIRVQAAQAEIPAIPYHQALGELASEYSTIAVTGTHGKSSTTAFLAHILVDQGIDPTVLIGADMPDWEGANARLGTSDYLLVEADEYRNHFHSLSPAYAIITSLDYDHPDFFASEEEYVAAYDKFVQQSDAVVTHEHIRSAFPQISWSPSTTVISAADIEGIQAPIAGAHMSANAALAIAVAEMIGISREDAKKSLRSFSGLARRMEELGTTHNSLVISDYAHHPAEISATIAAAREKYPSTKLTIIFQPHMHERLESFQNDFVTALTKADEVVLFPTFTPTGREEQHDLSLISEIREQLQARDVPTTQVVDQSELESMILAGKKEEQIIIGMSAGDLDAHLRSIVGVKKS